MFTAGHIVTIFEDPITRKREEGDAVLVKLIDSNLGQWDGDILQRWQVKFSEEPDSIYERKILIPEKYLSESIKKWR